MAEKSKVDLYMICLDRILAGEKNIGPVEDAEVSKLLRLAQNMAAADFSKKSEIRESLRLKILARLSAQDQPSQRTVLREEELTDEDLDKVSAAGSIWESINGSRPEK